MASLWLCIGCRGWPGHQAHPACNAVAGPQTAARIRGDESLFAAGLRVSV